ncbi:sporulation protein YjcZ [Ammoniphilus oxalaticus]|nr:sporulation protein YjcZ [Ammoniphilus oxalaticus]
MSHYSGGLFGDDGFLIILVLFILLVIVFSGLD